jgi:hypothetical protein
MGNPHVAIPWIAVLTPARSGDTTSRRRWWCEPGNCLLQPRIGSISPDKRAYGVLYVPLREHSWDPPGANFQRCHHRFQSIVADIQLLCTQFRSCNPPIRADELIETLFISWCDSCAWPSGTWLVFHVAVGTAETRHPPLQCADIHCLVFVNVHQASMSVIGYNFFPHGGIQLHIFASYPLPCQTPFCQTAPLLSSVSRQ